MSEQLTLNLEDLTRNLPDRPGWSVIFGATCAAAAAICLDDQGHQSPINLRVTGLNPSVIAIDWPMVDSTTRRFNADTEVATEYGAYGIAALVMPYLTGLTVIERSIKGAGLGFDFWLGAVDDHQLFQRKARLEVSGIRRGTESQLQSRVRIKLKQITPSDSVAPGYACVVEFGTPEARIVEKCRI
jgi:hypothetical protein